MVPAYSRRQVLALGSGVAATLAGGYALAARTTGTPDALDGWPMARSDPAGTGHAPDATPPKDDVTVAWQQPFDGRLGFGYGPSPVVADGRVCAVGGELVVLDRDSGEVQFRTRRNTRTAPALAPARAYESPTLVVDSSGDTTGLHADGGVTVPGNEIGRERWQLSNTEPVTASLGSTAPGPPPVVADGLVLVSRQQSLLAVDPSDGTVEWEQTAGRIRPVVADGSVYVSEEFGGLVEYDLQTGERRGSTGTDEQWIAAAAAGANGLVITTHNQVQFIPHDGSVGWRYGTGTEVDNPDAGALAVDGDAVYTGIREGETNLLVALDTTDGTELWRSERAPVSSPAFAPPAVADGTVYLPTEDGDVAAIDATAGDLRWRFDGDGHESLPMSPVAIADDRLYVTDDSYVYALEEP